MSIFFTVLKILLIVLLILIGLLVLTVCTVLFVPVRYRSKGKFDEVYGPNGMFQVSWLLRLVRFTGHYSKDGLKWSVKILFFKILSSEPKNKKKNKKLKDKHAKINTMINEESIPEAENQNPDVIDDTVKAEENNNSAKVTESNDTSETKKEKRNIFKNISDKIKSIIEKIKSIFEKIKNILLKISETKEYFLSDDVKPELKNIGIQLLEILKHIKPTNLKCNIKYGSGEPDKTGKTIGYLCILYGIYGKNINIVADFHEKVFEADYSLKGRIRAINLLVILIKIYNQKKVINYIKNFKL